MKNLLLNAGCIRPLSKLAALVILFLVLSYKAIIAPHFESYQLLLKRGSNLQTEFKRTQQVMIHSESMNNQVNLLIQQGQSMLVRIPEQSQPADLLSNLSKTVALSGLKIEVLKLQPSITRPFLIEWPTTLIVVGCYHQIRNLLVQLEKIKITMSIHNFEIQTVSTENKNQLRMIMTLKLYQRPINTINRSPRLLQPVNNQKQQQSHQSSHFVANTPVHLLKLVGIVRQGSGALAVIRQPDGQLVRVKEGDFLGVYHEKITSIQSNLLQLELKNEVDGTHKKRILVMRLHQPML